LKERLPGLYAIERDDAGERRFFDWRDQSPFRQIFDGGDFKDVRSAITSADLVFLSGITQAVVGPTGRRNLRQLLAEAKANKVKIAFDPNYRPRLWSSPDSAREALEDLIPSCSLISASQPDLEAMYGPAAETPVRWANAGIEVINRHEDRTVEVYSRGEVANVPGRTGSRRYRSRSAQGTASMPDTCQPA